MSIGSWLSKYIVGRLALRFVQVELLVGALAVSLLFPLVRSAFMFGLLLIYLTICQKKMVGLFLFAIGLILFARLHQVHCTARTV